MSLEVKGLNKYYMLEAGLRSLVLDDVSFTFQTDENRGKIKTILAPFGAGKSTLLKIISALEMPSSGNIFLNDRVYDKSAGEIAFLPENPSSLPWFNVKENIGFALKTSSENKKI